MKIGIAGASGRMGCAVAEVANAEGIEVAAGSVRAGSHFQADFPLVHHVTELVSAADVIIDFTTPGLSADLADEVAKQGKAMVSGTTGLTADQFAALERAAKQVPILWASNLSVGVALVAQLVEQAARQLDDSYDIEVLEMHHRHKKDAPSGTALSLGRAAAAGRGIDFDEQAVLSREGITGEREQGSIGFATLRGGEVIGDHTVMFAGARERIEISHKSSSRDIYAHGALKAARFLHGKAPGLYTMTDLVSA